MSVFYDKQRVSDLRQLCRETLMEVISPEVVLVTGKSQYMSHKVDGTLKARHSGTVEYS